MKPEEKIFKIKIIESYQKQINQEKENITTNSIVFGLTAVAAVVALGTSALPNMQFNIRILDLLFCAGDTALGAYRLKELIESISKKTMLQSKIEDINNELLLTESNEEKNMLVKHKKGL